MSIHHFEEIKAWQKGQDLAVLIYQQFGMLKGFSFRDQICRASVSISNNIAEGFGRMSGNKEFVRYLNIAKGSAAEVKSMLYLAKRLKFLTEEQFKELLKLSTEVTTIIVGFINAVDKL